MTNRPIASPVRTAELLKKYDLKAKKSLGQNFLMDTNILDKMLDAGEIDQDTTVIEIGPGIGALTEQLLQRAKHVYSFEIDQRFIPLLNKELGEVYDNFTLIHADILKVNLDEVLSHVSGRVAVVANLPYYITTPIIMQLMNSELPIDRYVLMMQKEVAERMTAQPHTKAYGSLTVAIDYYCKSQIAFIVPRTVFNPKPNVDSAILLLDKREQPKVQVSNGRQFEQLVRASFKQRRKTLWNNLQKYAQEINRSKEELEQALAASQIDPQRRAETLAIEEFALIFNELNK
ncbi:16S rRNA (adenine(1518)-N(6)/adenine(1519)-N(6))-dimethyltransferase RsmA [Atopobacter phocae]|uniref:16S rRNA (adenine(1518)-N(6)/adenine(1519)-N(6))- dimethyltransferase RsmA n=1 Tax=Atopobacter phocae TaxID=136492 RepID=UPI00047030C2|nr:16S rRNA (adenine(1518)-N(6)/adenine(1519)-N(6))-dimethyltransferase RsmA [Atopobacter phocae]